MSERLEALARSFAGRRVLVAGDLVADQFVFGEISRVSREAPVLILRHERTETLPGGAANCVMNLAALGAKASIVGVVGDDETGRVLLDRLEGAGVDCGGVLVRPGLRTTTKVRILAGQAHSLRQQVIRVDYENARPDFPTAAAIDREMTARLQAAHPAADAVIVSDYNYGAAGESVTEFFRSEVVGGGGKLLLADSRFRLHDFSGFTSATPNEEEVERWAQHPLQSGAALADAGERLRALLGLRALLITRGKNGMLLIEEGAPAFSLPAVGSHDAVDVTGAGDTVIAAYALALASGASFAEAARLANHAGGIVVMKRGTACVTSDELLSSLQRPDHLPTPDGST